MNTVLELIRAKGHAAHSVPEGSTVADAARKFLEVEVSAFLVVDQDQVVGIFTKNDLVRCCASQSHVAGHDPIDRYTSRDLFTVSPDAGLETVFAEMVRRGVRHVPVIEDGRAVGMITPIDILLYQKDQIRFENREMLRYIQGSY